VDRRVIVLCLNAGSSSIKAALFDVGETGERLLLRGAVSSIGREGALHVEDGAGAVVASRATPEGDTVAATRLLVETIGSMAFPRPEAIVHRLVHGGPEHSSPERYDSSLRSSLEAVAHFAPIHLPIELGVIDAASGAYPGLPQVVCYDTGFHRDLPDVARRLALPREVDEMGVRRYGFHGLSYEGAVRAIGPARLGRAVIAHLGSGASLAAVKDGKCVDTTMGLTPAGGLVMGTRSGDLDPGVIVFLLDRMKLSPQALDAMLNQRSGLLGVSETTSDMRALVEASERDLRARLAVEMFCYSALKFIGAFAAVLGGLDSLVFTGGIGERSTEVRWRICAGLEYLGVSLGSAPTGGPGVISAPGSKCTVHVVEADEERTMARHTREVLGRG
jgi:acetate kinase